MDGLAKDVRGTSGCKPLCGNDVTTCKKCYPLLVIDLHFLRALHVTALPMVSLW